MRAARLAAGIGALLSLGTISPAQVEPGIRPSFVVGPDGATYVWRPGDPSLGPLPASLARLSGAPVHALQLSGDGSTLVALPAPPTGGKPGRGRHEGSAVVVAIRPGEAEPSILKEVHFDGDGQIAALSADGLRAYVLSIRPGPDTSPGSARIWMHALDLVSGRVEASAALDGAPTAIGLDPTGERLYLGYAGRIVSYTTRPLARSWHYRSPGQNTAVAFGPRGGLLYAARDKHLVLFDAARIAARSPEERQRREDDATALVPLPFTADLLLFSRDGRLGAAHGSGNGLVYFDPESMRVFALSEGAASEPGRKVPVAFDAREDALAVAVFPERSVRLVLPPADALERKAPPPPNPAPSPIPAPPVPSPSTQAPPPVVAEPAAPPIPMPSPAATPVHETPPPPEAPVPANTPSPSPPAEAILAGRLTGRSGMVQVIVIYGPGSIVHEQGRATPDSGGLWRIPLPPPGIYRIVPLGEGSRPVRTDPHFLTVEVRVGQGMTDLDFNVLGTN